MQGLLIALSGARREVLDQCPTERIKFQSLGWAILITSGLATVSMWFALTSALGVNPFAAAPAALLWGLIIMGIDRWLVTSIPATGNRRWAMALPRLVLAVLLGTIISTPLVLRIFESEINAQIAVIKQERASAFLRQQANSPVGQQVDHWQGVVTNLQKVIDSGGIAPLDPAADPVIKSLTAQRISALALQQKYYRQWQCQLYGGIGCPVKGNGPLAAASHASYLQAKAQVAELASQIQQRERYLNATSTAARAKRLNQAREALPGAQQQLRVAIARRDALGAGFDAKNESVNGLLIRLQALGELTGKSFTLDMARVLLFLLFLVIECLPVTVKLLQRPGNYERILQVAADRELKDAKRYYRTRPQVGSTSTPQEQAASFREADTSLQDIWQPAQATHPATAVVDPLPGETDDVTDLDDFALRNIEDARATVNYNRSGGGIELDYADDEL